jgi:hypothetical protein
MTGSLSANLHEGSRSEYLAQFVFSSFGTAVPIPHQEDTGLDIYCTLLEMTLNYFVCIFGRLLRHSIALVAIGNASWTMRLSRSWTSSAVRRESKQGAATDCSHLISWVSLYPPIYSHGREEQQYC